ncbi:site-specific integrase [Oscillibacter sp. MSJ-2]|uniref:Site-specific integrase n=1 Tax=Dysosmobacter acutus TaxID=2841504 RepID=A0ABS6F8M3_9FIRM|nr:site-specific integrase [Dysosmobacter acutus]MBU5626517.1 site-specific integrase [Dysosmobacter acutus]
MANAKKAKYYQRPDGLFESIRTIGGKRVAFRAKTCREVDRKILEYREEQAVGRTYAQVLEDWWRQKEPEWAPSSASAYLRAFRRVKEALGPLRIREMRPLDAVRYLSAMKDHGYRSGTVGLDLSVLKMSCSWAVIHGDVDINPCAEVRQPKGLYAKKRMPLTDEQIAAVTSCRTGEWWLLGLMLLYTGCRRGELLALRYEDIDRKAKRIHIRKKLSYVNGNIPVVEDHTKSEAGMRDILLLPILDDAIPRDRIGLIFHEPDGSPLKMATMARIWKQYCRQLGFVEYEELPCRDGTLRRKETFPVTPHCFRHTFATICFEAGIDPKSTAAMLGHADEGLTLQLYTHLSAQHKASESEKLAAYVERVEAGS